MFYFRNIFTVVIDLKKKYTYTSDQHGELLIFYIIPIPIRYIYYTRI